MSTSGSTAARTFHWIKCPDALKNYLLYMSLNRSIYWLLLIYTISSESRRVGAAYRSAIAVAK